jgi:hypothetical protein
MNKYFFWKNTYSPRINGSNQKCGVCLRYAIAILKSLNVQGSSYKTQLRLIKECILIIAKHWHGSDFLSQNMGWNHCKMNKVLLSI